VIRRWGFTARSPGDAVDERHRRSGACTECAAEDAGDGVGSIASGSTGSRMPSFLVSEPHRQCSKARWHGNSALPSSIFTICGRGIFISKYFAPGLVY